MAEKTVLPGRRLGRLPPTHAPQLRLGRYLTGAAPAHPLTADHLSLVGRWMLGANDRFGTCGPTSLANYLVLTWRYLLGEEITVSDQAVFDLYRRSGNPGFNPATGQGDEGVVLQTMLSAFLHGGMTITRQDGSTAPVKPLAYASLDPSSIEELRAATSLFGGVDLGVDLQTAQHAQTDAGGPWDYRRSGEWGGHAILGGRYTSASGPGQTDETVVSWADLIGTTDTFMDHQLEEAWVVIMPAHLQHPDFQAGVDLVALASDYQALTGRTFPAAPGPAPAPPPAPPPSPPPAPSDPLRELAALLRQFIEAIQAWLTRHGL